MRVLLSTIGTLGEVQPLVALAARLTDLGHEVHLCAPPDFREWVGTFGIRFTPVGPELRGTAASRPPGAPAKPSPEQLRRLAEGSVATQFKAITPAARGCDVVVAGGALQFAARSVAEQWGIPYVYTGCCPITLPSQHHAPPPPASAHGTADNRTRWAQDARHWNDTFAAAIDAHRAAAGLAPVTDVRGHVFTDRPWLAADPMLAPWPEPAEDGVIQTGAWLLPDRSPLSAELREFLDAGEPPVYFGFGSIRTPHGVATTMIETARALGRRAIISRGWTDLALPADEPDCLSIGDVDQHALFQRVAAVVHHGGAGTTTAAALAGAPQVVLPQFYDQHYWASRVDHLGIGSAHPPVEPTTDSLATALGHALRPEVAARARSIADEVRTDGADIAAKRLVAEVARSGG